MRLPDLEKIYGGIDAFDSKVERVSAKVASHMVCSLVFAGFAATHSRRILRVLTTEGVQGITNGYRTFQTNVYKENLDPSRPRT